GKDFISADEALEEAQKELDFQRRAYERELRIANYEKDRAALQPGEPCPLCLSTHHPFREQAPVPMVDEFHLRLERAQKHCDRLAEHRNAIRLEYQTLLTHLAGLLGQNGDGNGRLPRLEAEIETLEAQWQRHWQNLPPELRLPLLDGEPLYFIARFDGQLQTRRQTLDQLRLLEERLQTAEGKAHTLQQEIARLQGELTGHESKLNHSGELCGKLAQDLEERSLALRQAGERLNRPPKDHDFDAWLSTLQKLKDSYEKHQTDKTSCEKELGQLAAERKSLQERIEEQTVSLDQIGNELEKRRHFLGELKGKREDLLGEEDPRTVKEQLQETLKTCEEALAAARKAYEDTRLKERESAAAVREGDRELEKLRGEVEKTRKELQQKLPEKGFADWSELEEALLSDEEAERIEDRLQQWKDAWSHESKLKDKIAQDLKNLEESPPWEAGRDPESLEPELIALQEQQEELLREIGGLQNRLQQNEQRRQEAAALEQAWKTQKKTLERWERLNDLIGSADGKKFRTYAQGLTLRK
ncbi:MAG: hypothetical protein D6765_09230, partial [Bacteroidetes bacterium]